MTRNNKITLFIILAIFAFCLCVVFPLDSGLISHRGLRQGLDLVGGVNLVYQAQFADNVSAADQSAAMNREVLTIQKRIDTYGVTEPIIQTLGNNRIQIQLPGFTDIDAAKALVEQTGFLEFRGVEKNSAGQLIYLKDYFSSNVTDFYDPAETADRYFVNQSGQGSDYGQLVAILTKVNGVLELTDANGNPADNTTLAKYGDDASWIPLRGDDGTALTGTYLADAQPGINPTTSQPEINITWNSEGAIIFDQIAAYLHNPAGTGGTYSLQYAMGIFLDKSLLSAPQLTSSSYEGKGTITGSFTIAKAQELANLLKSGALPVQLDRTPLYQQTVSATLGTDSLSSSMRAGIIGIILVALFMIAYYRYLGAVAVAALLVYGAISLTIFKLIPVTLTLPGIAGFIISVGMALDANVLIFERLKEEIRLGRTMEAGVAEGFRRAWPSIRDSNISTFITCIILYWFGSTFGTFMVKGFAVTLFIGVAVSMFSAIMVTRTFLTALIHNKTAKKLLLGSAK
jgi:preprotein translocase subunit SecD